MHSNWGGHIQANVMRMKSFTHMSCKCIRLLEKKFSSSKTLLAYLQYGKELLACWSCHTPLTGLQGPDLSPIDHPWDIIGQRIHYCFPSQPLHFLNSNTIWLNNGNAFHKGVGYNPRLLSNMRKRRIECIHKGGGHTIYDFQEICNHNMFMSAFIFQPSW